ncbi:hypothetical protein ABZP36_003969 [Zizania latifolia]
MAIRSLLCCLGTRRRANARQRHNGKSSRGTAAAADTAQLDMRPTPRPRRWMHGMRHVFSRSPQCGLTAVAPDSDVVVEPSRQTVTTDTKEFTREEAAAATIQAGFRGHLARRAFRALRSLVKLQALARGSYVRKQAGVAIRFMNVLVRLQVRVRTRQLLRRVQAPVRGHSRSR